MTTFSRREAMQALATAGAGAAMLSGCSAVQHASALERQAPEPDFVFAHLTDMHVRRKRRGDAGYAACVEHVRSLPRRPDLVLMGGDLAFDGLYNEKDEFDDQIALFRSISDSLEIPYRCALGNHDLLGWNARRKVPIDDPDLGKKMILDRLGMEKSYHSFDLGGWHFVMLDSLFPVEKEHGPDYEPRLGEEQLHWLANDLGRANKPSVCVSHHAAFHNGGTINGDPAAVAMLPNMVLRDTRDLRHVLERHGAKALLQGHSHSEEDYLYRGVSYLTSPSVSACWWGGTWRGFQQGYTVFEVRGERLHWKREVFPWEHHFEPEDTLERARQAEWEAFMEEQRRLRDAERRGQGG
jgi:3',5'-cyclic AMP phosphodiesterase CpdA